VAQILVGIAGSDTYPARYYVFAFVSPFGINSNEASMG
jgi:hypothetical protein